ncbi:hypothetical protein COU16_01530 [Candidatus Kaiserbacteria bacterium CG10_big_fil_rev_8_21_14_0_10_47_16]|uniref:Uncharacterized protein n=1 Tax=Candidatus Kaiserbacteria bacterium CG10_big_fil_rev_8_21_14_0_10_47_16 TaxID=1974608 RepID=A0A2H0UCZ3_9BACT|nr:MAG: hypothetical protein COU16_01530 [Candidatus Kaiserbacteria bacterium CG10_big_fil_rev_8_21_14_0_10_47_16]
MKKGEAFQLTWGTTGATTVSINNGVGLVPKNGSAALSVNQDTSFILTASNSTGTVSCATNVKVQDIPVETPLSCDFFQANPSTVGKGEAFQLTWATTGATQVNINNGVGLVPKNGSVALSVQADKSFILTASNASSIVSCTTTVHVEDIPEENPLSCDFFQANPSTVGKGEAFQLTWATTGATQVNINNGVGLVPADGSVALTVQADKTYVLTASNASSIVSCTSTVHVQDIPVENPLSCDFFQANPSIVKKGEAFQLTWGTTGGTQVTINNGIGLVPQDGSVALTVNQDTSFVLTASNSSSIVSCTTNVKVETVVVDEPISCDFFQANPNIVKKGEAFQLTWGTTGATQVNINNGVGLVPQDGSIALTVTNDTSFVLTASNSSSIVSCVTNIKVQDIPEENPISCDFFQANPGTVGSGEAFQLTWGTTGATQVTVNNGVGLVPKDGSIALTVTKNTSFVLTASNASSIVSCTTSVKVQDIPVENPLSCDFFQASPSFVEAGEAFQLSWNTTGATQVSINQGTGLVPQDGSVSLAVNHDTTYTLTATNSTGTVSCSTSVKIKNTPPQSSLSCDQFYTSPSTVQQGNQFQLIWNTTDANSVSINNGIGLVAADGSVTLTGTASKTYVLTASNNTNTVTCSTSVNVQDTPPQSNLSCDYFTATPSSVDEGDSFELRWNTTDATRVSIDNGLGLVAQDGSVTLYAYDNKTYRLTASNNTDSVTCSTSVNVKDSGNVRCDLEVSDDRINDGDRITLSWDNDDTEDIRLRDDHGKTLVDTDNGDNEDPERDSISVRPDEDTEYTLTAYGKKGDTDTCRVEVRVDDDNNVVVTTVRTQDPLVAGVQLVRVPYTGFDAGPFLTSVFYALLALWGVGIAYFFVVKKGRFATAGKGVSAAQHIPTPVATSTVASEVTADSSIPFNLPIAAVEPITGAPVMVQEEVADAASTIENRAHASRVLLSADALSYVADQDAPLEQRLTMLDHVITKAKAMFPTENGWMVINKERLAALLTA